MNRRRMLVRILIAIFFVLVPASAFAWGPLTHMYLGTEVFYLGSLLPPAILNLMRRYRQDFLYGNIMADAILAKRYIAWNRNSHNWEVALGLHDASETDSERAFSLGYISHLAADTVAHGIYTAGRKNLGHAYLELKADRLIHRGYWFQALAIRRRVQSRNDAFLEQYLDRVVFSFKTNKRIFSGVVALCGINGFRLGVVKERGLFRTNGKAEIEKLHEKSLDRMLDVLQKGSGSSVTKKDPSCGLRRGRVFKALPG